MQPDLNTGYLKPRKVRQGNYLDDMTKQEIKEARKQWSAFVRNLINRNALISQS